uniref:MULE transposase domain-containing protein n=1 Tax=Lactuca sativa TaxID=4236 RepID=A0A9R1WH02_LACSA|nr:hypothetical protein LSAT_V11C200098170 [Lactuca sativa]
MEDLESGNEASKWGLGCLNRLQNPRSRPSRFWVIHVGMDSNNGIYPVAYAAVETEATSSWTWFLELLGEDLDLGEISKFTFIYDRQKEIIPAVEKWKEKDLIDQLWECGRATTVNHLNKAMDDLKKINEEAHDWVCKILINICSKSHFSVMAPTDCLLNNLYEVFNYNLDEGRDKPIITCIDYIREYLMKILCVVQKEIDKCECLLTPTSTIVFDKINNDVAKYVAKYNVAENYQVFHVDMLFVLYETKLKIEKMPHMLMNGSILAIGYQYGKPYISTKLIYLMDVGRPKKKRRRGVDEPYKQASKLTRKYLSVTCSKCHNKGHNSITCKGQGGSGQVGGG